MSLLALVCFAVRQEAHPFQKLVRSRGDVRVLITGMGSPNAERSLREALSGELPRRVLTCGFAGALSPELRIGDVVFDSTDGNPEIRAKLQSLGARPAKFACVTKVATTAAEKNALRASTGADAVEMESRTIRDICSDRGIECLTVRSISDAAEEDLPLDFNQLMTGAQKLSATKFALALMRSPQKIPALLRLGQNSARAAERLAEVLTAII